ncbi:hypothetical protein D3C72_2076640 [compost metagenome]
MQLLINSIFVKASKFAHCSFAQDFKITFSIAFNFFNQVDFVSHDAKVRVGFHHALHHPTSRVASVQVFHQLTDVVKVYA